jgi:hypothetical protein
MPARERDRFQQAFGRLPDATLSEAELAQLRAWWNDPTSPYVLRRVAGYMLTHWGDPAMFPDVWTTDGKSSPAPSMPKSPPKSTRQHGHRFTDDEIYDAVARALADGVTGVGRQAEAHRPASGYDLWRAGQADGDSLPGGRAIRLRFRDRQTKRDRDVWAAVVRLGRKAGRIT